MKKLVSLMLAALLVLSCLSGLCFAADAEVSYTAGGATKEGTMADAVKAINEAKGGTIKLLKDYTYTNDKENAFAISTAASFTLDLNGKTINSAAGVVWVADKAEGVSEVLNGTIIARDIAWGGYGGLHMKGVTAITEKKQTVAFYDATGKWNTQNLIEECSFYNPIWGCFAFNNTKADQSATSMTFKNSTFVSNKKTTAIVIQSKAVAATAVFGEGMKLYAMEGGNYKSAAIVGMGETVTKAEGKQTVTVGDKTAENLLMWTTPETATVKVETPDVNSPEVEYTVNGETKTGTMAVAVKAVNEAKGGTVKLLKDYTFTDATPAYAITFSVPFVFDLNGFTFTSATRGIWSTGKTAVGVSAVIDSVGTGYMDCEKLCFCVETGGIYMNGVKAYSKSQQTVAVNETTADWNDKSLIENCTIVSSAWGAIAYNNTKASMENYSLTVKNTTLCNATEKGGQAFAVQAKAVESKVVLEEGVTLLVRADGTISTAVKNTLEIGGQLPEKAAEKQSVSVAGKTFDGFVAWTTKAPAEAPANVGKLADWAEVTATPAAPAQPTTPAAPATPSTPEPTTPTQPTTPGTPSSTGGASVVIDTDNGGSANTGVIIAIVAAAVVVIAAAVVVAVVLKKKK